MTKDEVTKALRQAYNFGQIYWQQADSEYMSQHKKADLTEAKFHELVETTVAALEAKDEPDKYAMDIECTKCGAKQSGVLTVHTNPPQRTWVGLTDIDYAGLPLEQVGLVRWAEAKLKEKNT